MATPPVMPRLLRLVLALGVPLVLCGLLAVLWLEGIPLLRGSVFWELRYLLFVIAGFAILGLANRLAALLRLD